MAYETPLALRPVWRFAVHVVVGSLAFLIVYMMAVGVDAWVDWTADHGAHRWMVDEARWVAAAIFWLDIFGLALFLLKETIKLCRHIVLRDCCED
ncbi:MAG: hypothetical protein ACJ8FB_00040 [Sphingomicrobium sp.]